MELRSAPAACRARLALEPEDRPTNWRRGIAKSLLAIVLAGVAAIGIGVAFAVAMPMPPTTASSSAASWCRCCGAAAWPGR